MSDLPPSPYPPNPPQPGANQPGANQQPGATLAVAEPDGLQPSVPPLPPAKPRRWVRFGWLGVIITFIAACAIGMTVFLGYNIGVDGLVIGSVAAIVPVPLLIGCFLWLDRYEPEPVKYLAFCFSWGAFVATAAALGVNTGASVLFGRWGLSDSLVGVLVAPFIEELMKALGPILLLLTRRKEWSGITDGIVYCGLSAVGFAMVENILYLGGHGYAAGVEQYGPATGAQQVFLTFIVRILFTGFAHPLFTSMTGVGLGVAARASDARVRWFAPLSGLLLAMMLHGTWNLIPSLVIATGEPLISLYGYLGLMIPIFFAMVGLAIWLRGWEGRLTERILPAYVRAGWLSPPEVAALSSLGRRHSARRWANRVAGEAGLRAMRGFQFAATRLALLRDGMLRGLYNAPGAAARAADDERELLAQLSGYRSVYVGRDPQAPRARWDGSQYHVEFPDGISRAVPAPDEPVVPIPVVLPPPPIQPPPMQPPPMQPAPPYGPVGYGPGFYR